ncbi:NACHT domain-containing protein [Actinomadura graeca]|uniref:NACHT domain-containing protein n=1 Tax=Actinomadura graeca TaxID=2750812 RepID=A0ABX8QSE1_9ACTN|nr:NACHT domain-containing protein [Actinomadura graeca]QXJ21124.1 NACHT domain-containing protein [Actinomadura graeca]
MPWVAAGVAVTGLVLLLAVTALPLTGADGLPASADTAQLTGLLVAVGPAAVGVVVWAWRTTRQAGAVPSTDTLTRAKDVLAGVVAEQWKQEARLRSLDDPDPIPVRWRTPEVAATALMDHPANIQTAASEGPDDMRWTASSADIAALADRFRRTRRRRLVILGAPGTGKTTLAMQLLLRLLATRAADEPIPVLFPVAGWDTERFPRLHDWLADRLARDYPALRSPGLGDGVVRTLAACGHTLPVLDGLDELPPPAQARLITALNRSLGGDDQLILTSRTTEFADAVAAAGDVVTSAAVLEPRPLSPADAADHLTRCLPPSPGPAWQHVLTELRGTPPPDQITPGTAPGRTARALAGVTATPLGLWLLRSVYSAPGADPGELADPARFPTAAALRAHLFDRLIPALIATRPPGDVRAGPFRPRNRHDPVQVRRWLGHLAHHLTCQPAAARGGAGGGTRDFAWWRLAAATRAITRTTAVTFAVVAALTVGLTNGLAGGLANGMAFGPQAGLVFALANGIAYGLAVSLAVGFGAMSWARHSPGYADLRVRRRPAELARKLTIGLAGGLTIGFVLGLMGWLAVRIAEKPVGGVVRILSTEFSYGPATWLVIGLAVGLATGLVAWAETPARIGHATTPLCNWRADRTLSLVRISTTALAAALAAGITAGPVFGPAGAFAYGLTAGPLFGLGVGLTVGLGFGDHRAWPAYLVATWRLAHAGLLPRRLMPFLDDCHRLGLLRAVGPLYQFRHAELHDHLAATHRSSDA